MAMVEPLPESVRSELRRLTGGDDAQLAVSTDIDGGGRFGERWLVATREQAYVFLPKGDKAELLLAVPLKDISDVNAEFLVGSGVLEVGSQRQSRRSLALYAHARAQVHQGGTGPRVVVQETKNCPDG